MENIRRIKKTVYLKPHENKCPVCGSTHIISVSRVTGYLAFNERFGAAKVAERRARVDLNGKHKKNYD